MSAQAERNPGRWDASAQREVSPKGKAIIYLRGFQGGASCSAIPEGMTDNEDFNQGYMDGRKALREATDAASKKYGCTFSVIREMS